MYYVLALCLFQSTGHIGLYKVYFQIIKSESILLLLSQLYAVWLEAGGFLFGCVVFMVVSFI